MLNTCFYIFVNMSISGSVVIAVLLLVRGIKIIPRRWIYPLWSAALLRLMIPVALASSISIFNGFNDLLEIWMPTKTIVLAEVGIRDFVDRTPENTESIQNRDRDRSNPAFTFYNTGYSLRAQEDFSDIPVMYSRYPSTVDLSQLHFPVRYKTQTLDRIFNVSTYIWISGTVILLFLVLVMYSVLVRQMRHARLLKDNLYTGTMVNAPFLLGIISPRIMLPMDLAPDSKPASHIITHEQVHIKRGDNLWRLAGLLAACLHWFNPLIWLGYSCFLKDMEFSCDEIAVKNYEAGRRKEYAEALLAIAGRPQKQNPIPAAFGKTSAMTRIKNVLENQSLSRFGIGVSIIFLMIVVVMLITNAQV